MQNVHKKPPRGGEKRRLWWLAAALVLLLLLTLLPRLTPEAPQALPEEPISTAQTLYDYAPNDVFSITIRRGEEEPWTVAMTEGGQMTLQGEDGFLLSEATAAALADAACIIPCEAVLTNDPAEYADHLADFGLDSPRYEAIITYSDGVVAHLRIGDPGTENRAWYYMIIEGDDRLFSFSRGMVEALFVSRDSLREIQSPVVHKARIDQITLTSPTGVIQWTLDGRIIDMDAADKWRITAPFTYPADAQAMEKLIAGAANLRLGAYVCPATPENLTRYGFDEPRLTISIHMDAGTIGMTTPYGIVEATDYPAATVTYVIGGARDDMVDYVRCGNDIYVSSHFTVGVFMNYDVAATMSRYPVMTALGNLSRLTIREGDAVTDYIITRTEQVAPNNDLVTDAYGNPVYTAAVTCNGEPMDCAAFEAAYNALSLVSVSGTLPTGEPITAEPHTVYTFTDVDGTVHTVALATFDALHDAVIVDGHAAFYLIKGGFRFNPD